MKELIKQSSPTLSPIDTKLTRSINLRQTEFFDHKGSDFHDPF